MADEKKPEYPNYIGKTSDISKELARVKKLYGKNYAELYERSYEYVSKYDYKNHDLATIHLMQFNMLADGLSGVHVSENAKHAKSQRKTFTDVPKECLVFEYRGFRILEEIMRNEPNIICLQECDQFEFLLHYLSPLGFKGEFNPKSSSPCVKIAKQNNISLNADGIAIFYNTKKYKLKSVQKYGKSIEKIEVDIPAICLSLTDIKTNKDFIVCCCHLKSTKSLAGETIRLNQLQHLLPKMKDLSSQTDDIPVFVACDLNTDSHKAYSSVYDSIMFPKEVSAHHKRPLKPNMPKEYVPGYNGLNLWSAYYSNAIPDTDKKKNQEPVYTTWKKRAGGTVKHCIDHIFYQKDKASVVMLLTIPSEDVVNQKTLYPGFEYPSDHIALQACFQF